MGMRVILDTGVFYRPEAITRLAKIPDDVVVPTVVLAERIRQVERDGFNSTAFRRLLYRCQFQVEPLYEEAALRHTRHVHDDEAWNRLARDALIAGHALEDDMIWTTNPSDFLEIGVPEHQIVKVD